MKKLALLLVTFVFGLQSIMAQTKEISGTVTSADDGSTIPGVSVSVKGTSLGAITDLDGKYVIKVPQDAATLVFSFVGMQTIEKGITGLVINVVMQQDVIDVDEVVVTAYGIRKKSSLTGSVQTVGNEKLEQIPVGSFENALQGTVAGVNVINSSGMPGSSATIRIRGVGSISGGFTPLYIMDGIEVSADDFSSMNANDIDNISILKDASATALYGSRGANGVVIITTKKGSNMEKAKITYRGTYGVTRVAKNKFNEMNSTEKLDYEEYLGLRTAGQYNRSALEKINTNWFDELTQLGNVQSHEISVQGGKEKLGYYISGGFYDEKGIVPTSDFQRFSAKINLDADASDWLKLGTYLNMGYEQSNNAITPDRDEDYATNIYNPIFRSALENPYSKLYNDDGSYATVADGLFWANPIEHLKLNPSGFNSASFVGSFFGEIKINNDLKFRSTTGIDFSDNLLSDYTSPLSAWGRSTQGIVYRDVTRNYKITNTNLFTYKKEIENHSVTFLLGQESVQHYYEFFAAEGEGLPNSTVDVLGSTATPSLADGDISEYSLMSFFSTLNYSYNGKYYFDASFRYDGASRFGENNRWAPFWSVAGMWDVKKENFLSNLDWISRLKFKASFGTTGNWDIGDYRHLALYGSGPTYNDSPGGAPSEPGNPDLTWEKKNMFNTGLEVGLFEGLSFELEWYRSVTSDMLFEVPYSFTSGFSRGWENVGKVLNRGIELSVDWHVMNSNLFKWNVNANVGYNHNEVLELFDDKEEIIDGENIIKIGESLGTYYLNRLVGVNPADGTNVWLDKDGNPTNQFRSSDQVVLSGKTYYAPWTGGLTSSWEYKGFSLSVFFSWMADKWMGNNTRFFSENSNFATYNQSRKVLDFWKKPGDITQYPDPRNPKAGAEFDDHLLEDASFLRLKDLTLGYSFSKRSLTTLKAIETLKVYGRARNLLTFSKYSGQDPEVDDAWDVGYYPHVRTIVFGVEIGF